MTSVPMAPVPMMLGPINPSIAPEPMAAPGPLAHPPAAFAALAPEPSSASAGQPSGHLRITVPQPLEGGKLGISIAEEGPEQDVVVATIPDIRASQLGWLAGDQVLQVNGFPVSNKQEFSVELAKANAEHQEKKRPLIFDIFRSPAQGGGAPALPLTDMTAGAPKASAAPRLEGHVSIVVPEPLDGDKLGIAIADDEGQDQEVTVAAISDPRALQFGWAIGDRVLEVNRFPVKNKCEFSAELQRAMSSYRAVRRPLVFDIWRGPSTTAGRTGAETPPTVHCLRAPMGSCMSGVGSTIGPGGSSAGAPGAMPAALHGPPATMLPPSGVGVAPCASLYTRTNSVAGRQASMQAGMVDGQGRKQTMAAPVTLGAGMLQDSLTPGTPLSLLDGGTPRYGPDGMPLEPQMPHSPWASTQTEPSTILPASLASPPTRLPMEVPIGSPLPMGPPLPGPVMGALLVGGSMVPCCPPPVEIAGASPSGRPLQACSAVDRRRPPSPSRRRGPLC